MQLAMETRAAMEAEMNEARTAHVVTAEVTMTHLPTYLSTVRGEPAEVMLTEAEMVVTVKGRGGKGADGGGDDAHSDGGGDGGEGDRACGDGGAGGG